MRLKRLKAVIALALCSAFVLSESNTVSAYNASDAITYAKKYAEDPNDAYDYMLRGDCTNFVSQCIKTGGKRNNYSTYKKRLGGKIENTTKYWYYVGNAKKYAASTSWLRCSGAEGTFLGFWKNYSDYTTYSSIDAARKNCKPGDVIQLCDKDYKIRHSIICVKKKNKEIYCASHTGNYKSDSLEAITTRAIKKDNYGSVKYLVYHFA